jgi:phenylacetate-CoA ligase
MSTLEKILNIAPYEAKQGAKYLYAAAPLAFRYGKSFLESCKSAKERETWLADKLDIFQNERLQALLLHAYQNVPYYRKLFNESGVSPLEIKTIHDLVRIPPLSKNDLRNNFDSLTAGNIKKSDLVYLSTSGTSGRPVRFYSEKRHEGYLDGDAYRWRHFRWGGCKPDDLRASMTAYKIPPQRNGLRRLYAYDPVKRLLILSAYDINYENIKSYARALEKYEPQFLHGFPSALEALVRFLKEREIPAPVPITSIFTQSEVLYPWQRELIEQYFGCKIFDWYGMEERVIAAAECEKHTGFHIFSDYCFVEVLKEGKRVVGEVGEIVSTRLDNYAMPLLRYRTGDMGMLVHEKCPCGRQMPLLVLSGGRDRNFLAAKNGGLISITIVDIPHATENVEQFQFLQEEAGAVTLKIIKKAAFSDHDLDLVRCDLQEKFGNLVDVKIEFVESIERTARGKLPLLIQKLNLDQELRQ